MIRNRIGDFEFISLSSMIHGPRRQLVREIRTGRNGVTLWQTGKRVNPFSLRSVVDTVDCDAAEDLVHQYEELVGKNPVLVTWQGKVIAPLKVVVMDVVPDEEGVYQTLIGTGGTLGTSNGMCRCTWLLQPWDPFQDMAGYE